jgi:hypothetical protein
MEEKKIINCYRMDDSITREFLRKRMFLSPFFIIIESFLMLNLLIDVYHLIFDSEKDVKNFLLCLAYVTGILILRIVQYVIALKKNSHNSEEEEIITYEFKGDIVSARNSRTGSRMIYPLKDMTRLAQTRNLYLLYTDRRDCLILKKDAFSGDGLKDFIELMKKTIPGRIPESLEKQI